MRRRLSAAAAKRHDGRSFDGAVSKDPDTLQCKSFVSCGYKSFMSCNSKFFVGRAAIC